MIRKILRSCLTPEGCLVLLGLLFGIPVAVVNPPFQAPDENRHFYRGFQLSELQVFGEIREGRVGGTLPRGIIECAEATGFLRHHPERKAGLNLVRRLSRIPMQREDRPFLAFGAAKYSPVPYIPQAVAMAFCSALGLSPLAHLYAGRLFNLLAWIALTFLAIRITPVFKWVFLLIALTPISLYLAASLSADCITNALSFLTIALLLRCALDDSRTMDRRTWLALVVLTGGLALAKNVYFLVSLLAAAIPVRRFGSRWRYLLGVSALLVISAGLIVAWTHAHRVTYFQDTRQAVSPADQMALMQNDPVRFGETVLRTIRVVSPFYVETLVGEFGWLDTPLSPVHWWSWAILLVAVAVIDGRREIRVGAVLRLVALAVFLGVAALLISIMYVYNTPVGYPIVLGVQGRYFIPILSLLLIQVYNKRLRLELGWFPALMLSVTFVSLAASLHALLSRYYG